MTKSNLWKGLVIVCLVLVVAPTFGRSAGDQDTKTDKASKIQQYQIGDSKAVKDNDEPSPASPAREVSRRSLGVAATATSLLGAPVDYSWDDWQWTYAQHHIEFRGKPAIQFTYIDRPAGLTGTPKHGYNVYDPIAGSWPRGAGTGCELQGVLDQGLNPNLDVNSKGRVVIGGHQTTWSSGSQFDNVTFWQPTTPFSCFFSMSVIDSSQYKAGMIDYKEDSTRLYDVMIELQEWNGDTITHLVAQQGAQGNALAGKPNCTVVPLQYFRKMTFGASGSWIGPQTLDTCQRMAHLCASRVSPKVAVIYLQYTAEGVANNNFNDQAVYCRVSDNAGITWGPKTNITPYNRTTGPSYTPWVEAHGMYDTNDKLHIVFNGVPVVQDPYNDATYSWGSLFNGSSLLHWSNATGVISRIHNAEWDDLDSLFSSGAFCGFIGTDMLTTGNFGISECNGRLYVVWVMGNDPDANPPIMDDCASGGVRDARFAANGEIYLSVSSDLDGLLWDEHRNLTNTYTPFCDSAGFGGICMSEVKPTMSRYGMDVTAYGGALTWPDTGINPGSGPYTGNHWLQMFWVEDLWPDQKTATSSTIADTGIRGTYNPLKWARVACVAPVSSPKISVSPESIGYPSWTHHGIQSTIYVTVSNDGNATLDVANIGVQKTSPTGPDWLGTTASSLSVPAGIGNTATFGIVINKAGTINVPGTVVPLNGLVYLKSNATPPHDSIAITIENFMVADTSSSVAHLPYSSILKVANMTGDSVARMTLWFSGPAFLKRLDPGNVCVLPQDTTPKPTPTVLGSLLLADSIVIAFGADCIKPNDTVAFLLHSQLESLTLLGGSWQDSEGQDKGVIQPGQVPPDKKRKVKVTEEKVQITATPKMLNLKWNGDYGEAGRGMGEVNCFIFYNLFAPKIELPNPVLKAYGDIGTEFPPAKIEPTDEACTSWVVTPVSVGFSTAQFPAEAYVNKADCDLGPLGVKIFVWEDDNNIKFMKVVDSVKALIKEHTKAKGLEKVVDVPANVARDVIADAFTGLVGLITSSAADALGEAQALIDLPPCPDQYEADVNVPLDNLINPVLWKEAEGIKDAACENDGDEQLWKWVPYPAKIGSVDLHLEIVKIADSASDYEKVVVASSTNTHHPYSVDFGQTDEVLLSTSLMTAGILMPEDSIQGYDVYFDIDNDFATGAQGFPADGAEFVARVELDGDVSPSAALYRYNSLSQSFDLVPNGLYDYSLNTVNNQIVLEMDRTILGGSLQHVSSWYVLDSADRVEDIVPCCPAISALTIPVRQSATGIAPAIVSASPALGAVDVSRDTAITVEFDKAMNRSSVESAFKTAPAVAGTFSWKGRTLTFTPSDSLPPFRNIEVTILPGAVDRGGTALDGNRDGTGGDSAHWSFRTEGLPLHTCDSLGVVRYVFRESEDIYVCGSGFGPSASVRGYAVSHDIDTVFGTYPLVDVTSDGYNSVSANGAGALPITRIGSISTEGEYSIIADLNANGVFDSATDRIDRTMIGFAVGIDCNHNGVADALEISANPTLDNNHNGVIDQCEVPASGSFDSTTATQLQYAQLTFFGNDSLVVSGIGSSGNDGVALDVGGMTDTASIDLSPVDQTAAGSSIQFHTYGAISPTRLEKGSASADVILAGVGFANVGGAIQVNCDFNPIGDPNVQIAVYNGTSLVGSTTVPGGGVIAVGTSAGSGNPRVTKFKMIGGALPYLEIKFDRVGHVTATNSQAFDGDRIRLISLGATMAISGLKRVEVTAAHMSAFTITNAAFRGGCCKGFTGNVDCDLTDGSDISDLTALIDNLYISFTPLCCSKEANLDGSTDGNVDISDLTALIDYLYISFTPPAACQ